MKKWGLISLLAVAVIASACGKKEVKPVDIVEGVDKCVVCNMMVANDQHATEIILKDGKVLKFDDIGDLFAWKKKNGTDNIDAQFVRDYHSKEWIKLEKASFAYDATYKTPMAYGVYSFKEKKDAEAFVQENKKGKVLTPTDLETLPWERAKGKGSMDMHGAGAASPGPAASMSPMPSGGGMH